MLPQNVTGSNIFGNGGNGFGLSWAMQNRLEQRAAGLAAGNAVEFSCNGNRNMMQ